MEEFITIGEKYGPFDIALLDSGQYNTAWHDVHMFPEEVVQAAMDLNASVILPIHISKYELALHHWYEPLEAISQIGGDKNIPVATPLLGSNFIMGEEIPNETWWRGISDCTEPFLDENPMAEYVLFAVGLAGIFWVVVPRVSDRQSILEEE